MRAAGALDRRPILHLDDVDLHPGCVRRAFDHADRRPALAAPQSKDLDLQCNELSLKLPDHIEHLQTTLDTPSARAAPRRDDG